MRLATMQREPILRTERLVLRPPEETDIDAMVAGLNDWEVARFLARVPFPYARADATAFLQFARRSGASGTHLILLVTDGNTVIGCMGLSDIGKTSEFGYWIEHTHWGAGMATEAGRAFLSHCFDRLGLDEIRAGAFADNPASLRVQRKLGFETTGAGMRHSLARVVEVAHIDTILTRHRFRDASR